MSNVSPLSIRGASAGTPSMIAKQGPETLRGDTQRSPNVEGFFNLRTGYQLPAGTCMYIQSGDPSDFDGYLIASAGSLLQARTPDLQYVVAVPERRAWVHDSETDMTKHDYEASERVMATAGGLLRHLCPKATMLRGLLNQRSMIPWRMMFKEDIKYGPLLQDMSKVDIGWTVLTALRDRILDPKLKSVVLDMNGSLGYLDGLVQHLGPQGEKELGAKLRASGVPVVVMAGVQAELKTQTLPLPGRDPRATANAIYYPDAVRVLLRLAGEHGVPLLFVTNNVCNRLLKFDDAEEAVSQLGLAGLLGGIARAWYGMPHLKGKCVPFDWVSFTAMLLYGRQSSAMTVSQQELYVDDNDPSVLVLRDPSQAEDEVVRANLEGTRLWGAVQSVTDIDRDVMLALARHVTALAAA